jgi:hypothetical protein
VVFNSKAELRQFTPFGAQVTAETKRSRFRHRSNPLLRKHPIEHDVHQAVTFVLSRRRRYPGAFAAAKAVSRAVDPVAMRVVIKSILQGGSYNRATYRRCQRLEGYCSALETAMALTALAVGSRSVQ